ncbi:carbon-nitrogen hydrolase family protein [Paenibacillus oenotherae]|uniref:Carbon-nitrogen hydrolase family protein n=1 Tax=Paenibacillus oenotherae TaxID=1435645 RepID=A0ABS7CZV6_9BACL|nr:carbon-nitrogen hydrolase family protein [Paenibacillus oenotherae]MBW7473150.1 carbon-nitrogen hydrolase family protein [Paenibacillus oenotherae]
MKKHAHVRVAVVQAAPVLFDKESAFERIASYAQEAGRLGVKLLVFPEVFLSGYPRGLTLGTRVGSRTSEGRSDWARYWESSIDIPGEDTDRLGEIAKENGLYLIVGAVERDQEFSGSTLYNSIVYIGPEGELLGKHRKLLPTGAERLLWGQGDGSTLTVIDTPFGRIGGLICWENYMPLARTAMYAKGIDILVTPTADARDTWQATLQHIACEGRCYVLSSNQYATKSSYPADLACYSDIEQDSDVLCRGGSAIVGPLGEYIEGPLYDGEGLLVADLDMSHVTRSRFDFDVVGHYNRPDVFQLVVNEKKRDIVRFHS